MKSDYICRVLVLSFLMSPVAGYAAEDPYDALQKFTSLTKTVNAGGGAS